METARSESIQRNDKECSFLLEELQTIWNDIGESDIEKDVMLLELEKECLEIYRRKVDQANRHRAQLRQTIAHAEAELATICSAMGERPIHFRQNDISLKEELRAIIQQLETMRERKKERLSQFLDIGEQIRHVSDEITDGHGPSEIIVDESDLSIRKLDDLQRRLDVLQKEKSDRSRKVLDLLNTLNSLCSVLDIDFKQKANEVHPSLVGPDESKNISSDTMQKLILTIQRLREAKLQRMHMLQDLATALLEMWLLMDTPVEEQQQFQNVTCNIAASEHEITEPNSLSMEFINHVKAEVVRLEELKASKMKELILKKKIELDELHRRTHLVAETDSCALEAIETESLGAALVLEQIEAQISVVKEEAFSRKEILERVEKWLAACEEESWLEEYSRDENRYNAGKGTHLMLKRAEKARTVVSKIPGMVETLMIKIIAWENERGTEFIYDGSSLLSMLEEYSILRQEKERERKRLRDQRRLQGQLTADQDVMFGAKPSPSKSLSGKKLTGSSPGGQTRRLSVGGATLQSPKLDSFSSFKYPSSAKKPDAFSEGTGGPEPQCVLASNAPEEEIPRKPFTPLIQPRSIPSTNPNKRTSETEEENKIPVGSPISDLKSPRAVSTPKRMNANLEPADFVQEAATTIKMAPQDLEISFEERRFALLLKG